MPIDINKHEVDIDALFKQNELDLCSIKELYRRLDDTEEKINQINLINEVLINKLRKEIESLKGLIQNETSHPGGV